MTDGSGKDCGARNDLVVRSVTAVRGRTWYNGGSNWELEARSSQGSSAVGITRLGPRTGASLTIGARLGEV